MAKSFSVAVPAVRSKYMYAKMTYVLAIWYVSYHHQNCAFATSRFGWVFFFLDLIVVVKPDDVHYYFFFVGMVLKNSFS
jgi:hypothetical protein